MTKQEIEQNNKQKVIYRNKIIASSSKETSEKGINIKEEILTILKEEGFNVEDAKTKYLASLIALLFHERKLYQRLYNRQSYQDYWNLDDEKNEHYHMIGASREKVDSAIKGSLKQTEDSIETLEMFIFRITDSIVQTYGNDTENIKYEKILKK